VTLVAALALVVLSGPGCDQGVSSGDIGVQSPPRPAAGTVVQPTGDLQKVVDSAPPNSTLILAAGEHGGPVMLTKSITIWGPGDAVVVSKGEGSTIHVKSDGVTLLGFTVDGSGARFDLLDAAVRVQAQDVRIEGLHIHSALFGILVEKSRRVTVRGNRVTGTSNKAFGLRGDAIRLWETRDSLVANNRVTDSRDVVVWYSSGNRIVGNDVRGSRYGTHFMYSHGNVVERNRYIHNVVGVFVMYSRNVTIRHNLLAWSTGAAGIGLGIKESGNLSVRDNDLLRNTVGIYIDTSPLNLDEHNVFERNQLRLSTTAVVFHASSPRNAFRNNALRDNVHQVRVDGRGDAMSVEWSKNHFDDYQGYDLNGDGFGDIAYELRSLSGELTGKYPDLALFRGTSTLALLDVAGHILPLFRPHTVLMDNNPRMTPLESEALHAR